MSYCLYFELKEMPPSLNVLLAKGWHFRSSKFQKIKELCRLSIRMLEAPIEPLQNFQIIFTRHTQKPLDIDNLCASFKPVMDALVINKVIEDDKWGMTEKVFYKQAKVAKKIDQKISVEVKGIK